LEEVKIRNMSVSDLAEVQSIEKTCFTNPWGLRSFQHELHNRDTILKVAVQNSRIVGYVCMRSILDITHLLNLTVIPALRRKGLGTMLFQDALRELRRNRPDAGALTLEVRESNSAAIRLYENAGFKVIGKRKGYFQKPHEDAVIMELALSNRKRLC
jgi:ribosomal-protein-alanine N-acetyltransferase